MQAPPSYTTPPKARVSPWVWIGVAGGGCCLCGIPIIAAILFPVFSQAKVAAQRSACIANIKQSGLAALMYASDHDDVLPSSQAWMDAVTPYTVKSVFQCPTVRNGHGYAMNDAVSRKNQSKIADPDKVVMIFETHDLSYNAHGKPPARSVPGPRHGSRTVAYVDGAARSIKNASR